METRKFQQAIVTGIPDKLPDPKTFCSQINHTPKRNCPLSKKEQLQAVQNALRYFPQKHHVILAKEFMNELQEYGHIYMYRFRPDYKIYARSICEYPHKSKQAAAIMLMISNNLDEEVAQHPHELITYGGNGSVFQNWAQYLLTMQYLATMSDEQTLVLYSGHPLGLFPSYSESPRIVITNGLMIPNYSKQADWEKYYALGVTQYGQMTAGSFMYIGPQGIVHGTTITLFNALRKIEKSPAQHKQKIFVSSGLGGMSGAQGKAAVIANIIGVIAEINPKAIQKRLSQGWIHEVHTDFDTLLQRIKKAQNKSEAVSLAYQGNIVDLWERLVQENIPIDMGSDQTSLHNPWSGGYYPVGLSFEEANQLMTNHPGEFKNHVQKSLQRQVVAINHLTNQGMYFFDYGNAFLFQARQANADILNKDGLFRYPSYIQDIMGPICFDYGFGPFRWICTSGKEKDLQITDHLAMNVLTKLLEKSPVETSQQLKDNLTWIQSAQTNHLVVGSKSRILYAHAEARIKIALAFNKAIRKKIIHSPIVIGRDHHDVSGTDSPFRETSNIYDGSQFTADMSVQNFVGNAFRGATWVSLHNGGGVGWGEAMNGGFGMILDGSTLCDRKIESMISWDVNNGLARRSWAGNQGACFSIKTAMHKISQLKVTMPYSVDPKILGSL